MSTKRTLPKGWRRLGDRINVRHTRGSRSLDRTFPDTPAGWAEAEKEEALFIAGLAQQIGRDANVTLGDWLEFTWLPTKDDKKPGTRKGYLASINRLRRHSALGNRTLASLADDTPGVMAELAKLRKAYKYGSLQPTLTALKGGLDLACRRGGPIAGRNPLTDEKIWVGKPNRHQAPPHPRLSPQQIRDLALALPEWCAILVYLGAWCGMRIGEACGFCIDALDLDGEPATLMVKRQVDSSSSPPVLVEWVKDTAEGDQGHEVILMEPMVKQFRLHMDRYPVVNGRGLLVQNSHRRMLIPDTFYHHWDQACIRVLGHRMDFHALRHSFVTRTREGGVPTFVVMAMTGQDEAMVNHYSHAEGTEGKAMAALIEQALLTP